MYPAEMHRIFVVGRMHASLHVQCAVHMTLTKMCNVLHNVHSLNEGFFMNFPPRPPKTAMATL